MYEKKKNEHESHHRHSDGIFLGDFESGNKSENGAEHHRHRPDGVFLGDFSDDKHTSHHVSSHTKKESRVTEKKPEKKSFNLKSLFKNGKNDSQKKPANKIPEENKTRRSIPIPKKTKDTETAENNETFVKKIPAPEKKIIKEEIKKAEEKTPVSEKNPVYTQATLKTGKEVEESLDGMYGVYNEKEKNPKKKISVGDILRWSVLWICVCGFITASYFVISKLKEYSDEEKINAELQEIALKGGRFSDEYLSKNYPQIANLTIYDIIAGKSSGVAVTTNGVSAEEANLISNIGNLKTLNNDMSCWIKIDGTPVNYPVMWTKTKNFYLHRDFYKNYLSAGTIYIDERNSSDISENRNTVMYGHNMANGSMFASLVDFKDYSRFSKVKIMVYTQKGIYVYTPFSLHESNAYDNYFETNFVNDADFIDFCNEMAYLSRFDSDFQFTSESKILTLSTCTNTEQNTRLALHAVLTQIILV